MAIVTQTPDAEVIKALVGEVPHEIYELTLERIIHGNGLDDALLHGWYVPQHTLDGTNYLEEIQRLGSIYSLVQYVTGEDANNFFSTFNTLKSHDLVNKYHYKMAYLRVPSCDVKAIWLCGDEHGHNHEIVVPLVSVGSYLSAGVHYSAQDFMYAVEAIAKEKILQEEMHTPIDDLARIEGIGPKVADLLMKAGISTFATLANTDAANLRKLLKGGGPAYNRSDPSTWSEQAALARDGDWDGLAVLQDKLKGGR